MCHGCRKKHVIQDNSFDVVISSECIVHVPDPKKALEEMVRVLKAGGLIIVRTPNKLWYPVIWLWIVTGVRKFAGRENWRFPGRAAKILESKGIRRCKVLIGGL
jgi:ubiquinone/menaquinone biosynthesis C-methylase UbiE